MRCKLLTFSKHNICSFDVFCFGRHFCSDIIYPQFWYIRFFIRCRSCWERLHDFDGAVGLYEETGAGTSAENREREGRRWASASWYRTRFSRYVTQNVKKIIYQKKNNPVYDTMLCSEISWKLLHFGMFLMCGQESVYICVVFLIFLVCFFVF